MLRTTILVLVALSVFPTLAFAQDPGGEIVTQLGKIIRWTGVFPSLLLIVGTYFSLKFLNSTVDRLGNQFASQRMLFQKTATILQFIIYIAVTVSVIALSVQLDDKVLTLIGGTFAVAVGFAIRDVVASFIAGIMVMIDRPFQVGDRVTFGGEYGDITAIGLRSVRMQTLDDNTITVPNNKFLTDITSNGNYGALDMQVVMDFHIAADQDFLLAKEIATEAALSSRYVYLSKPVVVHVNQMRYETFVAIRIRIKAYVLDTRYESIFTSDVNIRVLTAFREAGIQPPRT